jgi:hypothetical protein
MHNYATVSDGFIRRVRPVRSKPLVNRPTQNERTGYSNASANDNGPRAEELRDEKSSGAVL